MGIQNFTQIYKTFQVISILSAKHF